VYEWSDLFHVQMCTVACYLQTPFQVICPLEGDWKSEAEKTGVTVTFQTYPKFEVTLRLTVDQSVRLGIEQPCRTCDQILLPVGMLLSEIWGSCFCGAPSLTRGRVYNLQCNHSMGRGAASFSSKQLLNCTHEAEWTSFQSHYFSENLVALRIELIHNYKYDWTE
jgi:hypothetical protein